MTLDLWSAAIGGLIFFGIEFLGLVAIAVFNYFIGRKGPPIVGPR